MYLRALDGHLADHQRRGADLHVAVEDGEDLGVPLHLVADQVGDGVAHRAVELADHDLRLGRRLGRLPLDEGFAGAEDDPVVAGEFGFACAFSSFLPDFFFAMLQLLVSFL